ncbi:hypothetical protein TWF970_003407 [Orbilia oligospora]|uniref:USP domain-containing protein n=1 Tax=Orbilia oligospora TaxID=2813651 RepID=A0A7C8VGD7_ORBOL|nr:hypothetical protein TWF970_003407 [Orbilia oligospora]
MEGNGQNIHLGMAIENQAPTGQLSSPSPTSATSSNTINMNQTAINGTHFDGLNNPTPPRRPSYESDDESDPARPRKRPATLATVELLSAECMAAEANNLREDVNMANSSPTVPNDTSSEDTMAGDEIEEQQQQGVVVVVNTRTETSTAANECENTIDPDLQAVPKSDGTHPSPDSEDSSPTAGGSDATEEESYKNKNYVISKEREGQRERREVVHILDDEDEEIDSNMNQAPEFEPFATEILPQLQPRTPTDAAGRAFFIPMYTKVGQDLQTALVAFRELLPCISLIADSVSDNFGQEYNEGSHAWKYAGHVMNNAMKRGPHLGIAFSNQPLRAQQMTASKGMFQTLKAFFKLCLRVVQHDIDRIQSKTPLPYRPCSLTYLGPAADLCRLQPLALPQHYTEASQVIATEFWFGIIDLALDENYGFGRYGTYLDLALERLSKQPDLIDHVKQLFRLPTAVLKMTVEMNTFGDPFLEEKARAARAKISRHTYNMSLITQKKLKEFIGDNFLESREDFNSLVEYAAHLLNESVAVNPALIDDNSEFRLAVDFASFPPEYYALISDACLRMTIYDLALRKCKKLEIRLHALTTICNELLEVWKKRAMKREDPLLQCISRFIKNSGLVEYILGPHSHFQLIQKAANVVGFLIVMGDFDRHFVEVVWQPILVVKDQRETHATISLLQELCHNMTLGNHYDSCTALCRAPTNAWDEPLMSYFDRVIAEVKRHGQQNAVNLELPPYKLIIQLLTQSFDILVSDPGAAFTNFLAAKFDWLYGQLGDLLLYGPQIEEKKELITKCIEEIEKATSYKATNLYILNAVLESFPSHTARLEDGSTVSIAQEIADIDLVGLLVRQTVLCVEGQVNFENLYQDLHPIFKLLRLAMLHTPELIQDHQGSQLWLVLCGEGSRDPRVRNCSFGFFSDFLSQPTSLEAAETNTFMRAIFRDYFPALQPCLFVPSCLEFCKNAVLYFNQGLDINEDFEFLKIDGINQVWRIITTAPQDDVAIEAINYLVNFFADYRTNYAGNNLLTKVNCDLVNHSIKELCEAASFLGESGPESSVPEGSAALKFRRSLVVLQNLLESTPANSNITQKPESFEYPGLDDEICETLTIQFQGHAPKYNGSKCEITVPATLTGKEFYNHLGLITGFQAYRLIYAGKELFWTETESTLSELHVPNRCSMMLHSRTTPINLSGLTTNEAVRTEVQKHFADLHQLLTLPDDYSGKIWRLVGRFNPPIDRYPETKESLLASPIESATHHPFKLLYDLAIIRTVVEHATVGLLDSVEVYALSEWVAKTLLSFDVPGIRASQSHTEVVIALLDCLYPLISHASGTISSPGAAYDAPILISFLLSLLNEFQGLITSEAGKVGIKAFRSVLSLAIQNPNGLEIILDNGQFPASLKSFLLEDIREDLRKDICAAVTNASHDAFVAIPAGEDSTEGISTEAVKVALYIWKSLYNLIPHTLNAVSQSLETFHATQEVFVLISSYEQFDTPIPKFFSDWCDLLLEHSCQESIDVLLQDNVIFGLSSLLTACIKISDNGYDSSWTTKPQLGILLQERFLFPQLTSERDEEAMDLGDANTAIVLTTESRSLLNQLSTMVLQTPEDMDALVRFLKEILTEAAPGLPTMFSVDRSRWLRSEAGHVGLKNLSNTCYLNSLLTQLFMNLPFREFILNADSNSETFNPLETLKTIFANLQNSWQRAFEPKDFVATIRDYDGELIDVGIQMDVEEFYNLLCDRIESQIDSPDSKKDFRGFFGGTFVQQVKSMECEHVSEREESFSAIQCDIKGKKNLQESLKAFVEGETLNGDNKYSCTNCNKHVDAVKRTCLKQIPNQVIFHLKRFEFDLRTMNRSKINDVFEFPTRIDLHPFSIEAINGTQQGDAIKDEFELVGVLVHSGTAETGHYYSYIKDREGKTIEGVPMWFEFNDADVSLFDPSTIPYNCFGGTDTIPSKDGLLPHSFMKPYSAYMLFYERIASQPQQPRAPIEVEPELYKNIFEENENALRRYCLFDTCHLDFVSGLMHRLQELNGGCCTEEHDLEDNTLQLMLDIFSQIAIKIKDCEQTIDFLSALGETIKGCSLCCKGLLYWLEIHPEYLKNTLLKCGTPRVRQEFGNLIIFAAQNVDNGGPKQLEFFDSMTHECNEYFEVLCYHMRAWDDYFGFLRNVAELSTEIAVQFINAGFLQRSLEIFMIEFLPRATKMKYGALARFVDKGRKMLHSGLLEFIAALLEVCDLHNVIGDGDEDEEDDANREYHEGYGVPISRIELTTLRHCTKKNGLYILYKSLDITASIKAINKILKKLVSCDPQLALLPDIARALHATVAVDPAHLAEPSLQAIIVFLENVKQAAEVRDMVRRIAMEVKTIGAHGGVEHLSFFKTAFVTRNPNFSPAFIPNQVTENAKIWAPPLLTYHDEAVRSATQDFLLRNFVGDIPNQSEKVRSNQKELLRDFTAHAIAWVDAKFAKTRPQMIRDETRLANILQILGSCCEGMDDMDEDVELRLKVENIRNSVDRLVVLEEDEPSDLANSDSASLTQEIDLLDNDYSSN